MAVAWARPPWFYCYCPPSLGLANVPSDAGLVSFPRGEGVGMLDFSVSPVQE